MSDFRIRELLSSHDPSFSDAMSLYERSFPIEEREPLDRMARHTDPLLISARVQHRTRHLLIVESETQVVGMALNMFAPKAQLGWLIYLAVDPSVKRSGLGSRLLRSGISQLRLDAQFYGVPFRGAILEVERLQDALTEEDRRIRSERLSFFARQDAVHLTDTYEQPALSPDLSPVPLNLFLLESLEATSPSAKQNLVQDFMCGMWEFTPDDPAVIRATEGCR